MATRSQKSNDTVFGRTDDQNTTEVDGIDEELGVKLADEGFEKVTSFFLPQLLPALPAGLTENIMFLQHPFFSPPGRNRAPTV